MVAATRIGLIDWPQLDAARVQAATLPVVLVAEHRLGQQTLIVAFCFRSFVSKFKSTSHCRISTRNTFNLYAHLLKTGKFDSLLSTFILMGIRKNPFFSILV